MNKKSFLFANKTTQKKFKIKGMELISSWSENYNSWVNNKLRIPVCLIKYEDLIKNTLKELERMFNFVKEINSEKNSNFDIVRAKKTIAETLMDPSNDSVSEEHKVKDHGMFTTTFTRESWGLGTVGLKMINLPPSGGEFIMVNASCPVDNSNSILRWSMRVSKDIEDELGMAIIDGIANGVLDDMPIWDNKSYVADPILCDGDGPINKFRKWVSQFYSEPIQN